MFSLNSHAKNRIVIFLIVCGLGVFLLFRNGFPSKIDPVIPAGKGGSYTPEEPLSKEKTITTSRKSAEQPPLQLRQDPLRYVSMLENFCPSLTKQEQASVLSKTNRSPFSLLGMVAMGLDENNLYFEEAVGEGVNDPDVLEVALLCDNGGNRSLNLVERLLKLDPTNALALQFKAASKLKQNGITKETLPEILDLLGQGNQNSGKEVKSATLATIQADVLLLAGRSESQATARAYLNPSRASELSVLDSIVEGAKLSYGSKDDSGKDLILPLLNSFQGYINSNYMSVSDYMFARIRERELFEKIENFGMKQAFDVSQEVSLDEMRAAAKLEERALNPLIAFSSDLLPIYLSINEVDRKSLDASIRENGDLIAWNTLMLNHPELFTSSDFGPPGIPQTAWESTRVKWLQDIIATKAQSNSNGQNNSK